MLNAAYVIVHACSVELISKLTLVKGMLEVTFKNVGQFLNESNNLKYTRLVIIVLNDCSTLQQGLLSFLALLNH